MVRRLKKLVARLWDLPNAYRVLDIMDAAGCDIEKVDDRISYDEGECWRIKPKWYVSKKDAEDLRMVCLHGHQYRKRNRFEKWIVFRVFFRDYREDCRIKKDWV